MEFKDYPKLNAAADVVFLTTATKQGATTRRADKVEIVTVLVKRQEQPYNSEWALPGGFVDVNNTIEKDIEEKLRAKTGLVGTMLEQVYTYGDVQRDPRGRVLSIAYLGMSGEVPILNGGAQLFKVEMQRWGNGCVSDVTFTNIESGETVTNLAFDHKKMVIDTLNRVRNKIMYTDILSHMMPSAFTLSELQQLYNLFKGEAVHGFRALIEKKVEPTGEYVDGKAHRPAKLYRFK